jgi:cephalosporin-C deacetylase-like acetyl esterase
MKQFLLVLCAVACLSASDPTGEATRSALIRSAERITQRAASELVSREVWEPLQEKRREEMREMLGLLPWPERTPLNVQVSGQFEMDGYRVERVAFESRPKVYVTANLYVPTGNSGPFPVVIYVCGHAYSPDGSKEMYQRHGISLAKNGYAALIIDPIQIAETFALHHGVYNQEMPEWYARGYSPASVEVWNAIRAIDYLETRPEVDATRIGMTGRSGGAAMTWFTASVDTRVKVAVPVMGISTHAADLKYNTQMRHCDCMFLVNTFGHGLLHQGGLIAPRPLLMAHGLQDLLFPIPGYEEFQRRIGALYSSYDKADWFDNIVVNTGHADSDFLREQAIRWFDRFLKDETGRDLDMAYENQPGERLRVFQGGPPADAGNYRVHETFFPAQEFVPPANLGAWKERRAEVLRLLREKVLPNFPKDPPELRVRIAEPLGSSFQRRLFVSQEGVDVEALLRVPGNATGPMPALLYIAGPGEDPAALSRMFRQSRPGGPVVRMAVIPRGNGERPWAKSLQRDLLRNASHVGQTVDSLRLWDVVRAIETLRRVEGVDPARITVSGSGREAVLALYAAVLDESVHQVLLFDPTVSHTQGPYLLNVLRYTDVPEIAALLAPRRINFYSRVPKEFDGVKDVYGLYGAEDKFFVTMDQLNVMEGIYDHDFSSGL